MTNRYVLTFDIDWAPDFMILDCLQILEEFKLKGTFFATHETSLHNEIILRGHNLGIHPNFLDGSSHGSTISQVVDTCLQFAPHAWCMRTHSLHQSTPILYEVFSKFPQLKLDASLLMHGSQHAHKIDCNFFDIQFNRLLYNWEDDIQFAQYDSKAMPKLFFGELTVFNFHPVHVFLNSTDGSEYAQLKRAMPESGFSKIDYNLASKFQHIGLGTRSYLRFILESGIDCIELGDL